MAKSTEPIPVAVSACLLGRRVRYDGKDKRQPGLAAWLEANGLVAVAVCPEVEAGLAVPRPPVELVVAAGEIRALGVRDRRLDVTAVLQAQAQVWLASHPHVAGMICKSRSPSCGLEVPLHTHGGEAAGSHPGLFVQALQQARPGLPLLEETELADAGARRRFVSRVRRASASGKSRPPGR